jgi:ubiquinone biosynthesis monooxygenase Coq7
MRINHCGEVCAQALYQGQALTARNPEARQALEHAAQEETEHLAWTEKRIRELGGRTSVFNPLWYVGSLAIGVGAGILGDKWNLGFLEETEYQVEAHLNEHLASLPAQDEKSRAILTQMREDEVKHAEMAHSYGAAALPAPIKGIMHITAKLMKQASYRG